MTLISSFSYFLCLFISISLFQSIFFVFAVSHPRFQEELVLNCKLEKVWLLLSLTHFFVLFFYAFSTPLLSAMVFTSSPRSNASNSHLVSNWSHLSFSQEYMHFKCVCDGRRAHVFTLKVISDIRWERGCREEGVLFSTSQIILWWTPLHPTDVSSLALRIKESKRGNQATSHCINSFICIPLYFNWLSNFCKNNVLHSLHSQHLCVKFVFQTVTPSGFTFD